MADESLRLAAEIVDKWSKPLRDMAKAMQDIQKLAERGHREGTRHATDHTNKLWLLRREWVALAGNMRSVVSPALSELSIGMGGIGVSAAGVGIAVAAAIAAVKDFGKSSVSLINVSQQTKYLKEQVLAFQIAGEGMGLSVNQINESMKSFSGLMDQTNRRSIYAFQRWQEMPGLFELLGGNEFTQMKDRMAQTRRAIDTINASIPDADKRRRALAILGLPEEFAGYTKEQIDRFFSSANQVVKDNADKIDWDKGFDANLAFNKIAGELDILKKRVANEIINLFEEVPKTAGKIQAKDWFEGLIFGREGLEGAPEWLKKWWRDKWTPNSFTPQQGSQRQGPAPQREELPGGSIMRGPNTGKRSSLFGGNLQYGSFGGEDIRDWRETYIQATKEGVVQGLREFANTGTGGGGLLQHTSLGDQGGGTGGGSTGGGGSSGGGGFVGGGRYRMAVPSEGGSSRSLTVPPGHRGSVGGASPNIDDSIGAGLAGSDYLKATRQRFADEMSKDPSVREKLAAAISLEDEKDPVPVAESLFNRLNYTGGNITGGKGTGGLYSGFYGPINRGQLQGRIEYLRRHPKTMAKMNQAIDQALGGSNLIRGATDQGDPGDPNANWPGGRIIRHGREIYNDWGGGPGGHEGARRFRERQQTAVKEGAAKLAREHAKEPTEHTGFFRKNVPMRHRQGDFDNTGHQASLLYNAREAGAFGKFQGSASLDITLNGFPRGTQTKMSSEGMLKEVKLNRGQQMTLSSEDS